MSENENKTKKLAGNGLVGLVPARRGGPGRQCRPGSSRGTELCLVAYARHMYDSLYVVVVAHSGTVLDAESLFPSYEKQGRARILRQTNSYTEGGRRPCRPLYNIVAASQAAHRTLKPQNNKRP